MTQSPIDPRHKDMAAKAMEQVKAEPVELKYWHEMQDDTLELVACGKRWANVAEKIGCTVQGFDDDYSANFFTPDGTVIAVGPKFRAHIVATPQPAAADGLVDAAKAVRAAMREPILLESTGWSITKLNIARPLILAALAQIERKPEDV